MRDRRAPGLRVGAGRAEIRFPTACWPLDGFTGQHDPLFVRIVVLAVDTQRVVLVVADQTSLPPGLIRSTAERVASITGTGREHVLVGVSHTFSAPHLQEGETPDDRQRFARDSYFDAVSRAATDAALLRPAHASVGATVCGVSVNRDVRTRDGWWLGVDESGVTDPSVLVVRFDDDEGNPIALLADFAVQSSIMNESVSAGGARWVTADLAGAAVRHVEEQYDGAVCAFLLGAAGDQAPAAVANRYTIDSEGGIGRTDIGDGGFALVESLGARLGAAIVAAARDGARLPGAPRMQLARGVLRVPGQEPLAREHIVPRSAYEYRAAEDRDLPFALLRLDSVVLAGVHPELSATTGLRLKRSSPAAHTAVVTMLDGAAKYLPDATAFDRITYEAMSSRFAKGAAERLSDELAAAIQVLLED